MSRLDEFYYLEAFEPQIALMSLEQIPDNGDDCVDYSWIPWHTSQKG